jgi:hypothetical protein
VSNKFGPEYFEKLKNATDEQEIADLLDQIPVNSRGEDIAYQLVRDEFIADTREARDAFNDAFDEVVSFVRLGRSKENPNRYEIILRHIPTDTLYLWEGEYSSWDSPYMEAGTTPVELAEKVVTYYKRK